MNEEAKKRDLYERLKDVVGDDPIAIGHALLTIAHRHEDPAEGRETRVHMVDYDDAKLAAVATTLTNILPIPALALRTALAHAAKFYSDLRMEIVTSDDGAELQIWIVHRDGSPLTWAEIRKADEHDV